MIKKILVSFFALFFVNYTISFCLQKKENTDDERSKLNIISDKVEIIRDKNQIIFTGNVEATRENFTLYTDLMIVDYRENKEKKIDIKDIIAKDNVKFVSEKTIATGNDGIYKPLSNTIVLKNNVKATEDGITVFADEFEYNTITGKTKIIGNKNQKERVKIILDDVDNLKK